MTDQERISALEHEVATLKADIANLAAKLTLIENRPQKAKPPWVVRGNEPWFG